MSVLASKKKQRFFPGLRKKFLSEQDGYRVFSVDAFAVRNEAKADEEFTNFATPDDFPDLIPDGEIWISDEVAEDEGVFFIAGAITRLKEVERGIDEERAYADGLKAEQVLREKILGLKYRDGRPHRRVPPEIYVEPYMTIDDPQGPVKVWRVDGKFVRGWYKTDYTEGGHGYVYPWVPIDEIWIERAVEDREVPFVLTHEYLERRLMRDEGLEYDPAHEMASKIEFHLRKGKGIRKLLGPTTRRLGKRDLVNLPREEVYRAALRYRPGE